MVNTWPPIPWLWDQYKVNAAWYSGDRDQLVSNTYGFWRGTEPHKTHVPMPGDLAALAAGLLFCGSPIVKHAQEATDERLQEITSHAGLYQKLLHAAELQAVYGGVFLKWNWDKARAQYPLLRVVPADAGLPEYVNGLLNSVTFWSVVRIDPENAQVLYRLEEHYTPDGKITSKLMKGSPVLLGGEVPLESIPETQGILPESNSGAGMLLAVYVPSRLPNRIKPYAPYGRSDFEGLHGLFSALDEAYSSMRRDIRLGKTQIIVPAKYIRQKEYMFQAMDSAQAQTQTPQFGFSKSDEAFVALDFSPENQAGSDIVTFQPTLRAADHKAVIDDIARRIITLAGYSPQSIGMDIDGKAESGTALNIRERRSMQTTETKRNYWWHALLDLIRAGLALDKAQYTPGLALDGELTVEFADNSQPDMQTLSEVVAKLEQARAASTKTKVQILHPDWEDERVDEEVALIQSEDGIPDPATVDALLGDKETDPPPTDPPPDGDPD